MLATILIALGLITTAKLASNIIARFIGNVIDYAGELEENEARQFSKAWGDVVEVPAEMRTSGREMLSGPGGVRLNRADDHPSDTFDIRHTLTRHVVHGRGGL